MDADAQCVQNNILITQDGQACLGDFGIAGSFTQYTSHLYRRETLRYMAPERTPANTIGFLVDGPSKESDVYSLAMTSFSVCASLETNLLLDTTVSLRPGPHRGIALPRKESQGHYCQHLCR